MNALLNSRGVRQTSLVLAVTLFVSLVGCGKNPTDPTSNSSFDRSASADNEPEAWRRTTVLSQIQGATVDQLEALAACLPGNPSLPPAPHVPQDATLADIVALTPQITAFKQALVDYVGTLSIAQVVRITPCVVGALQVTDGSSDGTRAQRLYDAVEQGSLTSILAVGRCLESHASLPPAPALSAEPSLSEIVQKTPELLAYRAAVLNAIAALTLSEVVALTPCISAAGIANA